MMVEKRIGLRPKSTVFKDPKGGKASADTPILPGDAYNPQHSNQPQTKAPIKPQTKAPIKPNTNQKPKTEWESNVRALKSVIRNQRAVKKSQQELGNEEDVPYWQGAGNRTIHANVGS